MKGKLIKKENGSYKLVINQETVGQVTRDGYNGVLYGAIGKLSLKNCQAIERGYDLDVHSLFLQAGKEYLGESFDMLSMDVDTHQIALVAIKKALELMGNKKFSIEEVILISEYVRVASQSTPSAKTKELVEEYQSINQKEWDIDIVTEPMNIDEIRDQGKGFLNSNTNKPKLDADGFLILKRV